MTRRIICLIVIGVMLGVQSLATAFPYVHWSSVTISQAAIQNDPTLANMQTVSFLLFGEGDFVSAGMKLFLPTGMTFYRNPLAGNTKPAPAIVAAFPAAAFNTYVSGPADQGGGTGAPTVLGGFPAGQPASFGGAGDAIPGTFSLSWGDQITSPPGIYEIARLTFPQGVWPGVEGNPFGEVLLTNPDQTVFIWIPEPVAIAWVALLFPLVGRRR